MQHVDKTGAATTQGTRGAAATTEESC